MQAQNADSVAPSANPDQALHLQECALSYGRYRRALQRFLAVTQRRKRLFLALKRPEELHERDGEGHEDAGEGTQHRMFILSESEEPWKVFTSGSASSSAFLSFLRTKRLVFEWSDLHLSPLHSACISGDRPLVSKLLLQHQSCALARDASGRLPLHHAAINEQLTIVTLLLCQPDAQLQVHRRDNSGYAAAHYVLLKLASLSHRRYPQCPISQSHNKMKRVSRRHRRLSRVADEMLRLVSPGAFNDYGDPSTNITGDVDFSFKALDWRVRGDLWDATRSGDLERLKFLFQVYHKGEDVPVLSELRWSLLHEACDQQHLPALYYLTTQCRVAVKGLKDTSGCTVLHYAAMRGFLEGCVVLLEDEEDDSETLCLALDTRGRTALHWSLLTNLHNGEEQCGPVVKYLVTKCASALHVADEDGITPLHLAIWRGDLEIVEFFVSLGANVNTVSGPVRAGASIEKATAAWAPCGAHFHRRHNENSSDQIANEADSEKVPAGPDQEEGESSFAAVEDSIEKPGSRSNPQEDENVDGNTAAMDTLKYWLPRSKKQSRLGSSTRPEKPSTPAQPALLKGDKAPEKEQCIDGSAAHGCRKYGGVCSQCSRVRDPAAAQNIRLGAIPPLVLAIRACKRSSGSRCQDRFAIVELLLLSGADANEATASGDGKTSNRSPLIEALAVAANAYPRIVSLLLNHGANRIDMNQLRRFCLSSTAGDVAKTDAALLEIVDIVDLHGSEGHHQQSLSLLLAIIFQARCFNFLSRLLSRHDRGRAMAPSDDDQSASRSFSLWTAIRAHLSNETTKTSTTLRLGREHLWFLCQWLERSQEPRSSQSSSFHDDVAGLRALLRHCLDRCLATWRWQAKVTLVSDQERLEQQQMVSSSIEMLGLGLAIHGECGQHQYPTQWRDDCIALGFFDCALRLLRVQLSDPQCSVSMEHLLRVYGDDALGNRHHPLGLPGHRDFLTAIVEQCIITMEWAVAVQADSEPHSPVVCVSSESIVRVCAYNLPLEIVLKIWNVVESHASDTVGDWMAKLVGSCLLRMGGRTLAEWLVYLRRSDMVKLLLKNGANRVLLWRDFVCAVVRDATEPETQRELLSWLLTLYPFSPDKHHADDEGCNVIEWLALNCAVRCDSPLLFATIIAPLWRQVVASVPSASANSVCASAVSEVETRSGALLPPESLFTRLVKLHIFHWIAQWNALKLAAFLISEHAPRAPLSDSEGVTITRWRDVLLSHGEESGALAICHSLGHARLAQLLLGSISETNEYPPPELQDLHSYGLFNTILHLNSQVQGPEYSYSHRLRSLERLAVFQSADPWQIACQLNLVTHLYALQLHQVPVSSIATDLVLLAIISGSLDALEWLLTNHFSNSITTIEPAALQYLYEAASKHSGDLYARMTLLLLDKVPYTGRLAGDGSRTTLLHRCMCFRNAQLMQQAVDRVLILPGSSVNVLDAYGNAPVVYAIVSENLSGACYLVGRKSASLEAEFEGQASFYYTLQLLPSFAWRFVMTKLLKTEMCRRRSLHCDGGDGDSVGSSCGCKGFEASAEAFVVVCGFCGHDAERHNKVPFPPWFLDQYETYLGQVHPHKTISAQDSDNEDDEERIMPVESDEATLEDERGRLNIAMLTAIATSKYAAIFTEYKLSDPLHEASGAIEMASEPASEESSALPEVSSWPMCPLNVLTELTHDDNQVQQAGGIQEDIVDSPTATMNHEDEQLTFQPLHLDKELKKVHASKCCCYNKHLFTTICAWQHEVVSQWLEFSAAQAQVATSPTTTTTQLHLLRCPCWATRVAFARWRNDSAQHTYKQQIHFEARLSNNNNRPRLVHKLQQFLAHWRFAHAFVAFQRWKHTFENAQVRHMHLQALVDDVDAQMRRSRLETLREKHSQLQRRIAQL